jgi:colanic acid/amylovoran biosynthesis glycosyltransferase
VVAKGEALATVKDDARASARRVVHLTGDYVAPSQPWIYDLVQLDGAFAPSVVCERRLGADYYPFGEVTAGLPAARRFGWEWATRQLNAAGVELFSPRNRWRRVLQRQALDADVVHAHFGMSGWMAVDAGLAPVVTSFYGYDVTVDKIIKQWRGRYNELFEHGRLFVGEGPAMTRRIVALGAPGDRVRVLPLIADVDALSWRAPRATGELHVVMAGRFVEKKGFTLGLEAFAAAMAGTGATLTMMGDGPEGSALRVQVDRLGLADQVRFLSFASRPEYRALLTDSDLLLQPSLTARSGDCEGGAPTVLLDAQAIGTMVVASDHADIPFVLDPNAAYLAAEGDLDALIAALRKATASRGEWYDRSATARRHVETQHAPQAVARRRDDIYAEAAERVGR